MTRNCIGWDIGGAHLKAVLLNMDGQVLAATQVYCPLWRGLSELEIAIDKILQEFNADQHAVTMTGELADIFASRRDGVMQIAATLAAKLHGEVRYYAGRYGFVNKDAVKEYWLDIASMNWLASVEYAARKAAKALFVDIGSTTTDIALIDNANPQIKGFTDATRMQCDELVYTGVVRTPLMAMAQKISFAGQMTNVAAEYFATAADVYTLTGDLNPAENMADTADGADKTIQACACRIARMIGCDADDAPLASWVELASSFKKVQLEQIRQALLKQMALMKDCLGLQLIGAGAGAFLVAELALKLDLEYCPVSDFITGFDKDAVDMAAVCFPAYAVAYLSIKDSGVFAWPY
jgi:probable H4MPT-linked C1 transfer pathway protein